MLNRKENNQLYVCGVCSEQFVGRRGGGGGGPGYTRVVCGVRAGCHTYTPRVLEDVDGFFTEMSPPSVVAYSYSGGTTWSGSVHMCGGPRLMWWWCSRWCWWYMLLDGG